MKGYVYVATNKGFEDLVKIGCSERDPKKRAKELSTAGTVYPCVIKYEFLVNEPRLLEQTVHNSPNLKREVENREWFRCTVDEAIVAIKEVAEQENIPILYESVVESEKASKSKNQSGVKKKKPVRKLIGKHLDIFEYDKDAPNKISKDFLERSNLAKRGNTNSQYELGLMYQLGEGIDRDYQKAIEWYQKAAEQGNMNAQINLGRMFYNVSWLHKNYDEAVKWFSKAAEQDNAEAQYYLANMYQHGQGVCRNLKEAENWYVKALENGNDEIKRRVVSACLNRNTNAILRPDL